MLQVVENVQILLILTEKSSLKAHSQVVPFQIVLSIAITIQGPLWPDRMVVGFTTTYAINAYHHWCCEFESRLWRGVQHYVITFVSDL